MRRREFVKVVAGSATWPLAAHAQQSATPVATGKPKNLTLIYAAGQGDGHNKK
jgi:hypothetical protein